MVSSGPSRLAARRRRDGTLRNSSILSSGTVTCTHTASFVAILLRLLEEVRSTRHKFSSSQVKSADINSAITACSIVRAITPVS
eukprot:scaffold54943_cov47-Phaeocystis_antarctica.AAC.2